MTLSLYGLGAWSASLSPLCGTQRKRAEMNEEKDQTQREAESKVHQLEEKNKVCVHVLWEEGSTVGRWMCDDIQLVSS